jgi:hypothetical protein
MTPEKHSAGKQAAKHMCTRMHGAKKDVRAGRHSVTSYPEGVMWVVMGSSHAPHLVGEMQQVQNFLQDSMPSCCTSSAPLARVLAKNGSCIQSLA